MHLILLLRDRKKNTYGFTFDSRNVLVDYTDDLVVTEKKERLEWPGVLDLKRFTVSTRGSVI